MRTKFDVELFGERLNQLRTSRKISTQKLADALGVSHTTISKWEHGKQYPSVDSLFNITQFFNVPAGYLLGTEDKK